MVFKRQFRKLRPFYASYRFLRNQLLLLEWKLKDHPVPPPSQFKQSCVLKYRKAHNLSVLVETGTYLGEMITATYSEFADIFSIELNDDLYQRACALFANFPKVHLMHGDSASVLRVLLQQITQPCLFWLDAHNIGTGTARGIQETPILLELECILSHPVKSHVILVDDARLFDGNNGYPAFVTLRQFVEERRPDYSVTVADDIIRIHRLQI